MLLQLIKAKSCVNNFWVGVVKNGHILFRSCDSRTCYFASINWWIELRLAVTFTCSNSAKGKLWNLFKVNNKSTRTISKMLNIFCNFFECFCCWLWTSKCWLGSVGIPFGYTVNLTPNLRPLNTGHQIQMWKITFFQSFMLSFWFYHFLNMKYKKGNRQIINYFPVALHQ